MDIINNSNYKIILGSASSRRKELLEMTGINFEVNSIPVNEDFPQSLQDKEIAKFIVSNKKTISNINQIERVESNKLLLIAVALPK